MFFDAGCAHCAQFPGPVCRHCAERLLPAADVHVAGIDVCRAAYVLDDRAKQLIAALKYRRQRRIARWFAESIAELVPRGADCLTWLPATPERQRSRGFDQAHELARSLARCTDVPAIGLLRRSSSDVRQTGQNRAARLAGPKLDAVGQCPPFVVLIDDVITTGSSLRNAAQALRDAGAERIVGLVVAATPASDGRTNLREFRNEREDFLPAFDE